MAGIAVNSSFTAVSADPASYPAGTIVAILVGAIVLVGSAITAVLYFKHFERLQDAKRQAVRRKYTAHLVASTPGYSDTSPETPSSSTMIRMQSPMIAELTEASHSPFERPMDNISARLAADPLL